MNKKNYIKELAVFIFCILFIIALNLKKNFDYAVTDGIKLWATCILPAFFPYAFITTVISNLTVTEKIFEKFSPLTKKFFNVSGLTGYAFIMSIISGYPIGAKMVGDFKKNNLIGEAESVRGSALCSTSSPSFLIACVGNIMFKNPTFGLTVFIIHILSAIIVGIIFSFYKRGEKNEEKLCAPFNKKTEDLLWTGVKSAIISVLSVGGIITLFNLITEILSFYNLLMPFEKLFSFILKNNVLGRGLSLGLIESTKGLKIISNIGITRLTLPVVCSICGFGGISVIFQSLSELKKAKIKTAPFIISKIIGAVVNFILGLIFSFIFF